MAKEEVQRYEIKWALMLVKYTAELLRDMGGIKMKTEKPQKSYIDAVKAEYERPDRLSPEEWLIIKFYPQSEREGNMIFRASDQLSFLGINFDTGFGKNVVDWEIDWSLHINENYHGSIKTFHDKIKDLIIDSEEEDEEREKNKET